MTIAMMFAFGWNDMDQEEKSQAELAKIKRQNEELRSLVREWQGIANAARSHFAYYPEEWTKYYEKFKTHTNTILVRIEEKC